MTQTATPTRAPVNAADVRWLTPAQQTHWRAYRDGTALLMDVLARELDEDTALSLAEYEVLVRLSEAPGRTLRMSELAGELAHSRSRLTHTIRRMEEAGLVQRNPCALDARGVNCTMTDLGLQRIVEAAPSHVNAVRTHLIDVLTDDQLRALGTAMGIVAHALRES
ncbi:MAG: winged helix-turn-helix transcriptional regulator [Cellulomonas sp.]|uniref:MarR family winged helix-turn-helix transcriptional regulator n=1 Tax=Cellulomonas sp. TaxID=40001 RepID=UPI00184AD491|nr:MarR family winged helix-turn-helix transcriptional regulator [Cellulomonas sp.]NMM31912.1 winged helix-turn-helix transcriptional regulator [Cellulomonas sp.]